jgi:hypothetical protein
VVGAMQSNNSASRLRFRESFLNGNTFTRFKPRFDLRLVSVRRHVEGPSDSLARARHEWWNAQKILLATSILQHRRVDDLDDNDRLASRGRFERHSVPKRAS